MYTDKNTYSVCFFNSCKSWGGGEKWHFDAAIYLAGAGHDVRVVADPRGELYQKLKQSGIEVFPIEVANLSFFNLFKLFRVFRYFKSIQPHAVIFGLPSDVKIGGIAAKCARIRKIIYRRGTALPVSNTWLNTWLFRKVVTGIITNSREIRHKFLERNPKLVSPSKIRVLYNGIDLGQIHPNGHANEARFPVVLGNAGRLVEQKGQKYLIEVARLLAKDQVPFQMLIAGKGKLEKEIRNLIAEHGLEDRVVLLDFVSDMNGFFEKIDILLFPSLHEGSSHTLLEAMAWKKPIVAFRVSSMPEIIEEDVTGFLVDFPNVPAFAEATKKLVYQVELRRQLGEAARDRVEKEYAFHSRMDELMAYITE